MYVYMYVCGSYLVVIVFVEVAARALDPLMAQAIAPQYELQLPRVELVADAHVGPVFVGEVHE